MDGLDYYGMERRRLLAEGSCSSGLIGHRAAVNNDSGIATAGETSKTIDNGSVLNHCCCFVCCHSARDSAARAVFARACRGTVIFHVASDCAEQCGLRSAAVVQRL